MQKSVKTAVYPGSFDLVTNGHMDIISRASAFTEKLMVAVLNNSVKVPFFTVEERMEQLRQLAAPYPNVEVDSFSGLLVDYLEKLNASLIIRGLRTVSDFELERQMAWINQSMRPEIETVLMLSDARYLHVSSSAVRELARHGGDFSPMVPPLILEAIQARILLRNAVP